MGLSCSQLRFLALTERQSDINWQLQHLALQKTALTRDVDRLATKYTQASNTKVFKWSNNSGVTYTDLSYDTLMHPNAFNPKSPILLTNSAGRVVVDSKYKKYAEKISENGTPGGSWGGELRLSIISDLTGISADKIISYDSKSALANNSNTEMNNALSDLNNWKSKESEKKYAKTDYLKKDDVAKLLGTDFYKLYKEGANGGYKISRKANMSSLITSIENNLSKYFVDNDLLNVKDNTKFKEACKTVRETYEGLIDATGEKADSNRESYGLKGDYGDWTIDMSELLGQILGAYSGTKTASKNDSEPLYAIRYTDTDAWNNWIKELGNKQTAYEKASENYTESVQSSNEVLTADEEAKIEYYDLLFNSIVDNGWSFDDSVEDKDYLNQMLQNNGYYVTEIKKTESSGVSGANGEKVYQYSYDTSPADNYSKLCKVNDNELRQEALVDYEYQKSIINAKEARIDARMQNLKTENESISKMMEGLKKVGEDNIEMYFNLWA